MSESTEVAVRHSKVPATVRAMRPRKWVKTRLVVTPPLHGARLFQPAVIKGASLAFVAFCLVSAAVYLVNDVRDVEEDRLHPTKRFRPIAAGELKHSTALVLAAVLGLCGLALSFVVSVPLGITALVYVVLQLLYSAYLKHLPVVDLAVVASAFLLRAISAGCQTPTPSHFRWLIWPLSPAPSCCAQSPAV